MCRAMEELWKDAEFRTKIDVIRSLINEAGWTKEKALELCKVPASEYPKYLAALG